MTNTVEKRDQKCIEFQVYELIEQ